jgi:hypothetical protein
MLSSAATPPCLAARMRQLRGHMLCIVSAFMACCKKLALHTHDDVEEKWKTWRHTIYFMMRLNMH